MRVPQLSDPEYKTRPRIREADLRHHLINEIKASDPALEEDAKGDPRFAMTAEQLKAKGIADFQLNYAVDTIARLEKRPVKSASASTAALKKVATTR